MTGFLIAGRNGAIFMPYDLSTCILHCMRNNMTSLMSSSLVCRSWSAASRCWIFRRLSLGPKKYSALLALIQQSATSAYSFLAWCRSLDLHSIDVRTIPPFFVTLFTALREFRLQHASVPSLKDLFEFTSGFPQIHSIILNHVFWRRTAPTPLPPLPTVTHLDVCGTINHEHFLHAIEKFQVFPNLLHLAIGPLPEIHMPALGSYLANPGVPWKVRSLTVSVIITNDYSTTYSSTFRTSRQHWSALQERYHQIYGIEPCSVPLPHLLFLRVKGFIDVNCSAQGVALQWIPRMFASMDMQNIHRIELDVILDRAGQLDQFGIHWFFIDFAFTTTSFANLKEVVFNVHGPSDLLGIADIICRRLPLSTERGILYVRSGLGEECYGLRVQAVG